MISKKNQFWLIILMVLVPIIKMELEEINELPETIRGEGGFGSTGK